MEADHLMFEIWHKRLLGEEWWSGHSVSGSEMDNRTFFNQFRQSSVRRLGSAVLVLLLVLVVQPAMRPPVQAASLPTIPPNLSHKLQHVSEPHVMKMLRGKTHGSTSDPRSSPFTESNLVTNPGGGNPSYVQSNPSIYISFWGSDWQSGFTDNNGFTSAQASNYVRSFLNLLGGSNWFDSQTQYCQGIATGTQNCPPNAQFVHNLTSLVQGIAIDSNPVTWSSSPRYDVANAAFRLKTFYFGSNPAPLGAT